MLEQLSWGILAIIHVIPAFALFKPSAMTRLYGVEAGSQIFLLMRHRAALFLGVLLSCLWAIWNVEARQLACVIVSLSMLSFLWLFWSAGYPKSLRAVAIADAAGLPFLLIVLNGSFSHF